MNHPISRLDLERYVLDELPEDRMRILTERIKHDPRLGREVRDILQSNREDAALYPAGRVIPEIRDRCLRAVPGASSAVETEAVSRRRRIRKYLLILSPVLTAALILAVIILPGRKNGILSGLTAPSGDGLLVKGTAGIDLNKTQLLVYRQQNRSVEQMTGGEKGRAGDLLQLAYVSTSKYGLILSLDGAGTVSLHFPEDAAGETALEIRKKILLPQAIELDDAPRFERIFLITSETPLNVRSVLGAAESLARNPERAERDDLALAAGMSQTSFLIRK